MEDPAKYSNSEKEEGDRRYRHESTHVRERWEDQEFRYFIGFGIPEAVVQCLIRALKSNVQHPWQVHGQDRQQR